VTIAHSLAILADKELVERIVHGDLEALGELFDLHESALKRFIGRLGVSPADVDDLVQATFLEVPRAASRFDPSLVVKNWLLGLATIMVRRHRRSLARAAARLLAWANVPAQAAADSPATAFEKDEALRHFQRAFAELSAKKREVFALIVLEGLSGDEVARTLGIPVNTVWTRLHHARRDLRQALAEDDS
jgi:RNA polymerase sigma-70 factor (ECF subfamily)